MNDEVEIPPLSEVIEDPATSWWLRESLERALFRNPTDALNDAILLAALLEGHVRQVLKLDITD